MIRKAFVMQVNPDQHAEYERRHQPIWDELALILKKQGAHHYSIFLDQERSLLFGYVEIECEARWNAIADTPICQKWWQFMADIMPSNSDHSPVSRSLKSVFYLD